MSDIINVTVSTGISQASLSNEAAIRAAADAAEAAARLAADNALDARVDELEENGTNNTEARTISATSGTIPVTIDENADYVAFDPTGNFVFNLTGAQTNGKEFSFFVNGTGNGYTGTVTGANLFSDNGVTFDDAVGFQYCFFIFITATGVPFYIITKYAEPTVTNLAPSGTVSISGSAVQGQTLTGSLTFTDNEGDTPGTHQYQWYRSSTGSGAGTPISGATGLTYQLTSSDVDNYVRLGVIPIASTGTSPGSEVFSSYSTLVSSTDTASPTVTVNSVTSVGVTTGTYNGQLNENGTIKWAISTSSTPPTKAAILAGTGMVAYGSLSASAGVTGTASITELTVSTTYYVYCYGIDSALNESAVNSGGSFSTSASDTTAPTVTFTATSATNIRGVFDENVSATILGYSFKKNTTPITPSAITQINSITYDFTVSGLLSTDTLLASYDSTTGNTVDLASNELVSFTDSAVTNSVPNLAPTASPTISGTAEVGQTLTANAGYADTESDVAGTHLYQWYRADNASGLNEVAISGATNSTYVLVSADNSKYIRVIVTPVAVTGTSPGSAIYSSYTAQITTTFIMTDLGSNLLAWYKSDNTIKSDSNVTSWPDSSANAYTLDAIQGTPTENGDGVEFQGSEGVWKQTAIKSGTGNRKIFIVLKNSASTINPGLVVADGNGGVAGGIFSVGSMVNSGGTTRDISVRVSSGSKLFASSIIVGQKYILEIAQTTTNVTGCAVKVNNVDLALSSQTAREISVDGTTSGGFSIGGQIVSGAFSSSNTFFGHVYEVVYCNALTTTEENNVRNNLATRHGITL